MVMSTAYSSKTSKFPLLVLQNLLLWNHKHQATEECQYYGLRVEKLDDSDLQIRFQKGDFNEYVKMVRYIYQTPGKTKPALFTMEYVL